MIKQYGKLIKRASYLAILVSSTLIVIKLCTWWLTGSLSMLSSLVDSLIDLLISVINFFFIRYSLKPADKEHTFGHGKAESLASLIQSVFIIGMVLFLILNSTKLLIQPKLIEMPLLGMLTSFISIVLTALLLIYQRHVIKETNSPAIRSDRLHYLSDLIMNIAVMLAILLSWLSYAHFDAIFALIISVYIAYSALKIAINAIQELLDHAIPEDENQRILNIIGSLNYIHGIHDLKTRCSGAVTFIQLHIELEDNISLFDAHAIADNVEQLLTKEFAPAEVIIHLEPISIAANRKTTK